MCRQSSLPKLGLCESKLIGRPVAAEFGVHGTPYMNECVQAKACGYIFSDMA
jgi:hypothetical protein